MNKYILILISSLTWYDCRPGAPAGEKNQPLVQAVEFQGHRGARGLYPENSLKSFETAMKFNATTLELDTVLTADGQLVVHHDRDINPDLCLGPGEIELEEKAIIDTDLEELKGLDCGSKTHPDFPRQKAIPGLKLVTLDEVIEFVLKKEKEEFSGKKFLFNIEVKLKKKYRKKLIKKHVARLIEIIQEYKIEDRVTVQSFEMKAIKVAKKLAPEIPTAALFEPSYWQGFRLWAGWGKGIQDEIIAQALKVNADIIAVHFIYVDFRFVKLCHMKNLKIYVWTVNDKEKMYSLLEEGVDGIISDYPDIMKTVAESYKRIK